MVQNLDVLKGIISTIIENRFDLDMLPFFRHCDDLRQEAEIFVSLHPEQAQLYLTQGKITLYNTRLLIIDHLPEVHKSSAENLKVVEIALVKLYDNFARMLSEIENP